VTQAELAERMGVRQERVSAIERADPGAAEVRTLAGYVQALAVGWYWSPTSAPTR
jgi:transcriptional regulator with XRE-family HTH domain